MDNDDFPQLRIERKWTLVCGDFSCKSGTSKDLVKVDMSKESHFELQIRLTRKCSEDRAIGLRLLLMMMTILLVPE